MRIFHVATLADWQRAKASGTYTTSTYGATLDEVGFLHAARAEQVAGVLADYYYARWPSRCSCSRSTPTCWTCRGARTRSVTRPSPTSTDR